MLRVFGSGAQDCDGITRRSFLQAGVLGVGGLALPDLLRLRAAGATVVREASPAELQSLPHSGRRRFEATAFHRR